MKIKSEEKDKYEGAKKPTLKYPEKFSTLQEMWRISEPYSIRDIYITYKVDESFYVNILHFVPRNC